MICLRHKGQVLVLSALFAICVQAQGPREDPPVVTAINVQPAPARTEASFLPLVTQKIGEPLDRHRISDSIRNLFATGEFADIKAVEYAAPGGGVKLVFETQPNYFLGAIRVENAPDPPTDSELQDASGLEVGHLFNQGRVQEATASIHDRLATYGYHLAKIDSRVSLDHQSGNALLVFLVNPGWIARVGRINFAGNLLFSPSELLEQSHLSPGKQLTRERLQGAINRLQKFYSNNSRVTASVNVTKQTFVSANNTVDLSFSVDPGPLVNVTAEGARLSSHLESLVCGDNCVLRHEVPIFQEHSADSELIEEGRRNLQNRIQQRGFFDAKVESRRLTPKPGELDIRYLIHPGAQEAVDSVSFRGNHYFSADDLRDTVATRPTSPILPNFIPGARGNFSDAMVQDDAAAISSLYKGNGFAKVQVTPSVNRRARGKPDHIAVTFQINEGPQMLVGKVAIRGNQAISTAEIQGLLTSTPGQPYSDANVATDRDAILSRYYNAGYSEAQLNIAINSVKNRNVFDIAFNITEGPRQTVNKVFVRGERFVKPNVIQHQIQVHPGEALSQLDMLDTQRNLYNLGLFTDVNVAVENPTGLETSKNVIVTVREARRYTFNELVGLQVQGGTGGPLSSPTGQTGISPLLGFDVTRAAMTGRNQTLSFKSRYGTLQKRALLSYSMPQFLNHSRLNANFTTQYDDTFDVRTFRARRAQGSMQFEQTHSPTTKLVYRFEYRRVSLSFPCAQAGQSTNLAILAICGNGTLPTISEAEVPLLSRPEHLAMATSAWIRDRRDDPLNTFHGNFNTAELGLARSFGDFSNFTRGFFENASYYPLGKKEKTVLARATRLGVLLPFNKVAVPNSTIQQSVIPLPERFFSGGGDSLRGFSINQAGPRDPATGFPIGGNTLFINNVELRFPMIGENIGGVLFYDAGNVYTTFHDALRSLLRYNAPSPTDLNFTSHTLGTGIRYRTPVGPVRVDFGFNLNPPAFQTQQTICPNNQSTCPPSVAKQVTGIQQLSHFHFFFSIGQTF